MSVVKLAPLAVVFVDRRRQATFRIGLCMLILVCYGPHVGWKAAAIWAAAYSALQGAEACCLSARNIETIVGHAAGRAAALALLAVNSLVFGGFSLEEVAMTGPWGQTCAAYLLAGSISNTVLTTVNCRSALYASLAPFGLYLAAMPVLALTSSDRPSIAIVIGIAIAGLLTMLSAMRLWRGWSVAKAAGAEAIARDLAERAANEKRLYEMAHHDALTGLGNRNVLQSRLTQIAGSATPAALLMIDLDGFKYINDTLGHSAGDQVLRGIGTCLNDSLGHEAVVVRLGGDEFAILLPMVRDRESARNVANRVIEAVSAPLHVQDQSVSVGASVGIAFHPVDGTEAEALVSNADLALYRAKRDGRHCVRFYEPRLRADAIAKRSRDDELRRAIEREEFRLYYQPQVRLRDGAVTGAEALLRWEHPKHGLLAPSAFLAAVESSNLAGQVGGWVIRTACRQAAIWRAEGHHGFRVNVNLFGAQFRSGNLVSDVERAIAGAGLPYDGLGLEITENIVLRHEDEIVAQLRDLRGRGVSVSFDDYGTGYASLSLLKCYPLTHIKIDQSFVRGICDGETDATIVRSVIGMARACGLGVVAEGVETTRQRERLLVEGCELAQGYLFGRPMREEDFAGLLRMEEPEALAV